MWGGLSIGYTYPPLRAEPLKAGETGSRSVWMKKKIFFEYIYNVLNRHESHPVVTMDRLGTSPREPDNEGHGAQVDLVGGQMNGVVDGVSSEACQAATRIQCSPSTKPGRSRIKMRQAQCIK